MPITTQLRSDLRHGAAQLPHLDGHPPRRSGCQQRPPRSNPWVLFNKRADHTLRITADPATLPPPKPNRPPERRQIHQPHRPLTLRPHPTATVPTDRTRPTGPDHHLQRCPHPQVVDADQINLAQAHQQLAHTRRISLHRGPPASDVVVQHPIMEDPCPHLADYRPTPSHPNSPLISEEPEKASNYRSQSTVLFPSDVAYARLRPYLNKVALIDRECLGSAEFIVLPKQEPIMPEFLVSLLRTQQFVEFAVSHSTGDRPRLIWSSMATYRFGLPPIAEQERIVLAISEFSSHLDNTQQVLEIAISKTAGLRASILAAALAGNLVPQCCDDEPASVLLERIAQSRPAKTNRRRRGRA